MLSIKIQTLIIVLFCLALMPLSQSIKAQNDPDVVINKMVNEILVKLEVNEKITFAVFDFQDNSGKVSGLGSYLAEKASMAISNKNNNYKVMDKTFVEQAIVNKGLPVSKMNDIMALKEACANLSIQYMVTGKVVTMGNNYEISLKVITVSDASLVGASNGKILKTEDLQSLNDEGNSQSQHKNENLPDKSIENKSANAILIGNRWELICQSVYPNRGEYWMMIYIVRDTKYDPKLDEERSFRLRIISTTSEKGTIYNPTWSWTTEVKFNQDLPIKGEYEINRYKIPSNTRRFIFIEGELALSIDGRKMLKPFSAKIDMPVE